MLSLKLPREAYIPTGAVKVTCKAAPAIAYVYTNARGRPCAVAFLGARAKPVWCYSFANEVARERRVRQFFEGAAETAAFKAKRSQERKRPHTLEVGHVLESSWGYDQTNVDFYQVTAIIGPRMVEIRQIHGKRVAETAWLQGHVVPDLDNFKGEPMRKIASHRGRVTIDHGRGASVWDGRPVSYSAYA
jgi:hypothetical protein